MISFAGWRWIAGAVALLALAPLPAAAQLGLAGGAPSLVQGAHPKSTGAKPPPPALPGARGGKALAPAAADVAAMNPTEALFDAINRDDVAQARDALGRGADLRARDALGMTPLQLSIDLGRNDITFLLLSMRHAEAPAPPPPAGGGAAIRPAALAAPAPARPRRRPAPAPVAAAPVVAAGGGAPVPDAGFLGFDPGR
ncbi:MAG: ankyrin repeat domain-containing protein [Acetobacteraceae bacterium]